MDIPLREVQVLWDHDGNKRAPAVKIMRIGERDDPDYLASWGACNADFNAADAEGQLRMLFQQFHQLVTMYEIDPQVVHEAFLDIPEYRRNIAIDLVPSGYRERDEDD